MPVFMFRTTSAFKWATYEPDLGLLVCSTCKNTYDPVKFQTHHKCPHCLRIRDWQRLPWEVRAKRYIKTASFCPYCRSMNIEGVPHFESDCDWAEREVKCPDCGRSWKEEFRMVSIEEIP